MESKERFFKACSSMMTRIFTVLVLIWVMAMSACRPSENIMYEEFVDVDPKGWNWDAGKSFTFEITDETHYYNLLSGLRITSAYAYSNIWMLYTLKGPDGFYRKDQFQLVLSDNIGRWKGKGVSNLISYQEPFLMQLPLKKGKYTLTVFQNMRDENLESVNNLGLQVVRGQLIL
jgi:gliding motility-associated lipoprotein GldH